MPSPESLLERESRRSKTEVEEVEIFLKEAAVEVEEVETVLFLNADLSLKEKRGTGDVERGAGEAVEGHSEKIPESRRLSPSASLSSQSTDVRSCHLCPAPRSPPPPLSASCPLHPPRSPPACLHLVA